MQHHVFLSYSHKDIAIMQQIRTDLSVAGLRVWTDETLTPGTESWKNAIEDALQNTGTLVVILSPDAKQSVWVEREIDYARLCGVSIFPILARGDSELSAVPFQLINAQRVDIRTNYDAGIRHLIAALQKHLGLANSEASDIPHHSNLVHLYKTPQPVGQLDSWNFFDQARLVWWLFVEPTLYLQYVNTHGEIIVRQTGAWVVSSIMWISLLAPAVGYTLNTVVIPTAKPGINPFFIFGGLVLLLQGFITARLGASQDRRAGLILLIISTLLSLVTFVSISSTSGVIFTAGGGKTALGFLLTTGIAFGFASGIAFRIANSTTGALAGVVIAVFLFSTLLNVPLGVEGGFAGVVMAGLAMLVGLVLHKHIQTGQRSLAGTALFGILIANFAVMMWLYFLGGWQVLAFL